MAKLSEEMKRLVERQRLGFVATVCPDGTPSVSPKGTVSILDDEHLIFADIRSPGTVSNLRTNPSVEVVLRGQGEEVSAGQARSICFLIRTDGRIRWARIDPWTVPLPRVEELLSLI
jgi:predicted pyridoxine 5'-phosphate oxidase superfamily flavin-nucleotide-binding protein